VEDRGKHPAEWFYRTGFLYIPIESLVQTRDLPEFPNLFFCFTYLTPYTYVSSNTDDNQYFCFSRGAKNLRLTGTFSHHPEIDECLVTFWRRREIAARCCPLGDRQHFRINLHVSRSRIVLKTPLEGVKALQRDRDVHNSLRETLYSAREKYVSGKVA
jgi:hypothetical protein